MTPLHIREVGSQAAERRRLFAFLLIPASVFAQASGSINGIPIPARVFAARTTGAGPRNPHSVCGPLVAAIQAAALEDAKKRLAITVTDDDLKTARSHYHDNFVSDWKALHDRTVVAVNAISLVYDKGQNPDEVYKRVAQPGGVDAISWQSFLKMGQTPEGRKRLASPLQFQTPEQYRQAAEAHIDQTVRPLAERIKLDQLIDQTIAKSDPQFAQLLQRSVPAYPLGPAGGVDPGYLGQKRRAWWMAEMANLNVSLSDHSLYSSCQLSQMGINTQ